MGKWWTAAALMTLGLFVMAAASPLAGARGETAVIIADGEIAESTPAEDFPSIPAESELDDTPEEDPLLLIEELPEGGLTMVTVAEPAVSLWDVRSVPVDGVPAEARDAVGYAVCRGLLQLKEDGGFDGEDPVTRGEAVSALYRLSGALVRTDGSPYEDLPPEYEDAAVWASAAGISDGVSDRRFAPNGPVTRSQLAVMLHRFAAWRGQDTRCSGDLSGYEEDVPAYAEEALCWALESGLYQGLAGRELYPALPVSRQQLAEIFSRLERDWGDPLAAELELPEHLEVSLSQLHHEELQTAVDRAARRHGAVGVQVAVVERGEVTDSYTYGWAVKGSVPMTSAHKMRTASLSKVAVGLSAALLWEEGIVDYDADIGVYWGKDAHNPRHPGVPVSIRSILTHTSTLLNSESIAWDYAGVRAQLGSSSGYGGGTPGSLKNWSYNNHAFGILGQTLELASGQYLDDVLRERVLDCTGADGAFAAGELDHPELITPLYRGGSVGRSAASMRKIVRWSKPGATGRQFAGGFTTSAVDMAKIAALLAGDGCFGGVRLMSGDAVALMESHSWDAIPGGTYQALPMRFRLQLYGREGLYYHTGSAYGVYNLFSYDPFTGDGVVVLTMGADGGHDRNAIYAVCSEISQAVYDAIR